MKRIAMVMVCTVFGMGCDAKFTNFDPLVESFGADAGTDDPVDDGEMDGGQVDGTDAGPTNNGQVVVVAEGSWEGRRTYNASGTVRLEEIDGRRRVVLSDDFRVSGVPGPFIVTSTRDSIGNSVQEELGDRLIAPLQANSGAQTYDLPADLDDVAFVWVYCRPFTVEIARAELVTR